MPGAGGPETPSWAASSRLTVIRARGDLSVSIAAQSPIDLYGEHRPPGTLSSMVLADLQFSVLLYRRAHLFAIVDDGLRYLLWMRWPSQARAPRRGT
jgi:hypothetical protein